jgi:hypothetical protein
MLSLLTACGASVRGDVPPSLKEKCALPVELPERALSDREVEVFWGRDRSALRACGSRHSGLVGAI